MWRESMGGPDSGAAGGTHDRPELWAGIECTVNRVGDQWFDQLELLGHTGRADDLDAVAALGIAALRYPVLWETVSPDAPDRADWRFPDERLLRLRALGVRPIVTLVHHGSGPRYTDLLDPGFAEGLAVHAAAVAERYPWLDAYTPVNEPLTTARFSALYGHWYPHHRSQGSFLRALVNECRATVLAMQAIRRVNPSAQLIQTEDLGKTHSTPRLRYQARRENHRRWLSMDLLCGRVGPRHPMRRLLLSHGIAEAELAFFRENPCPPDVMGFNYYVTSERYLDHRVERYPAEYHGGNDRGDRYADIEALRGRRQGPEGLGALLREAWARYRRPLAITECHLGGTRDEQMRWLAEGWDTACALRREGVDLRALTIWAALGLRDWNRLVTRLDGHYESGMFDVRSGRPRPTALAELARALARGERPSHPAMALPGWWRREDRLLPGLRRASRAARPRPEARPVLIAGAGTLGRAFARACEQRGLAYRLLGRAELDIGDAGAAAAALAAARPWAVVNAAGYVDVDGAEREPERCHRDNHHAAETLARACAAAGLPLATFSSNLVFDGRGDRPYVETDETGPSCVYGLSKAAAERAVLAAHPSALVVRAGAFLCGRSSRSKLTRLLDALAAGERVAVSDAEVLSASYVPDVAHTTLDLLVDGADGLWHLANGGGGSWFEMARAAARLVGAPVARLAPAAPRTDRALPRFSVLGSLHGAMLPPLDKALHSWAHERNAA
ncbi:MAG TPA: family 1 glycosylhydrolase [Alphaproteobacteria bacterium]|nr:family 1 glycosylhydrolase [Alphaproteobacteria bacterium]